MTCKNCAYSTPYKYPKPEPQVQHLGCSCPKLVYEGVHEADNLVYWDASSYAAGFSVGPDFGCVHFRPKEVK